MRWSRLTRRPQRLIATARLFGRPSYRQRDLRMSSEPEPPVGETHVSRNIIVCCDGTANEFTTAHTNVLKLFSLLQNDPARQITFYHPGLGTMEAAAALTSTARK